MAKYRATGADKRAYPNTWPVSKKAQPHSADQVGGGGHARPATPKPDNYENAVAGLLVLGFILLQIMALVAALLLLVPRRPASNQGITGTLIPPPTSTTMTLVIEPPPPTATRPRLAITPGPEPLAATPPSEPATGPPPPPPAQPPALRLRGMELTQGIQVFNEPEDSRCLLDPNQANYLFCNNSMPLVAGRHTLVRVYPACNGECPATETTVQLRLLKDGQEQVSLTRRLPPGQLQRINGLSIQELRGNLDYSVNFEFFPPPAWLSGQITFELEARPTDAVEASPATLSLTKEFAVRKPLRIAYVPIQYQGFRPPEPADIDYWLLRLYPVSNVEYFRLPVPDLVWEGELNKSEILRNLLYTYWLYAQYHPEQQWPDQLFGWLPQEIYNGGVSDPYWCPNCVGPHSSRVAFGGWRPEQDIGGPRILVHEIAHNLGAQHAWSPTNQQDAACFKAEGADIRVDPQWPYTQTPHIQEFGIDLYSNPPIIYPPSFYDMMAYCARPWISPHTYRKLFESPFLQPDAAASLPLANFKPQAEVVEGGTLLVSGVIYPNGTVSQPEIIHLEGNAFANAAGAFTPPLQFTPPPGQDYCLEVQASDGSSLARHCFDVGFVDLDTGLSTEASPYFFTLPGSQADDIARVTVSKNEVALVIATPSNTAPRVTVTYPNGGEILGDQERITWEASDADGDRLLYDLLYSPDGGQSWLPLAVRLSQNDYSFYTGQVPPSERGLVRVIASDGFHTGIDQADAPFTIQPPLENSIRLLGPSTVKPGQTFDVAIVASRVAEPGLFGAQFKLNFDPALLQVEAVRLHPGLNLVVDETIQNEIGQASVVASRQGQVPNLSGDITLATFTFTATSNTGEAHLFVSDIKAGARGGQPLHLSKIQELYLHIAE